MPTPTFTSRLGLRKPDPDPLTGDFLDVETDLNENLDKIDAALGAFPCTDTTRPSNPYHGQFIRETNTRRVLVWNETDSAWDQLLTQGATFSLPPAGSTAAIRLYLSSGTAELDRAIATRGGDGDTQDRFTLDYDGKVQWGSGLAAPDTNLYRSAANTLRTDDNLLVNGSLSVTGPILRGGSPILPNFKKTNVQVAGTTSTAPGAFVDVPGLSLSFTKQFDDTPLAIWQSGGGFLSAGLVGSLDFGVRINGADYTVFTLSLNAGNHQEFSSGVQDTGAASIPAGLYTIQGRVKGVFGAATFDFGNNRHSIGIMEVAQ